MFVLCCFFFGGAGPCWVAFQGQQKGNHWFGGRFPSKTTSWFACFREAWLQSQPTNSSPSLPMASNSGYVPFFQAPGWDLGLTLFRAGAPSRSELRGIRLESSMGVVSIVGCGHPPPIGVILHKAVVGGCWSLPPSGSDCRQL